VVSPPEETVSVTDSIAPRPFDRRVEGFRVVWRARALDPLRVELPLRAVEPLLDERRLDSLRFELPLRAVDPPLDDRALRRASERLVLERDLDELGDAPRPGDDLVWAMVFLL